jgi:hypothetical protein
MLAHELSAQGHEVHFARDTAEGRWRWIRNYFDSVIVCARGANGFVERIKKESPHQTIAVVSEQELTARKPPASVISIGRAGQRNREIVPRSTKVIEMPRREPNSKSK